MATIANMLIRIGADITDLDRKLVGAGKKIQKFGNGLGDVGDTMTRKVTAPIVAGFVVSTISANNLNKKLREVNALTGLVGAKADRDFKRFQKGVAGVSKELGIAQQELAGGLYQALSAGVPKDNALTFLEVAAKSSVAGVTDVETAIDGLTTNINAFGLGMDQAGRVSDVMFATVKQGKTNFAQLSSSMFQVAGIAKTMGVSLEDTSGAIATLTKQGTPTAVATTQIRSALQAMMAPNADLLKAFKKLNVEGFDQLLARKGSMQGAFQALYQATGGNKEQMMKMFGSVEAVNAVLGLTGSKSKMAAADLLAIKDSAGATDTAFAEMDKARNIDRMIVSVKNLGIAVGSNLAPTVGPLADKLANVADKFGQLDKGQQESIIATAAAVAALGPLLKILGNLIVVGGAVAKGAGGMLKFTGAIVGGVNRAILAIRLFFIAGGGIMATVSAWAAPVVAVFSAIWGVIVAVASAIATAIAAVAAAIGVSVAVIVIIIAAIIAAVVLVIVYWDKVKAATAAAWGYIANAVSAGVGKIIAGINGFVGMLGAAWDRVTSLTVGKVAYAFGFALGYIIGTLAKIIITVAKFAIDLGGKIGNAAKNAATALINGIRALPGQVAGILGRVAAAAGAAASAVVSFLASRGKAAGVAMLNGVRALPGQVSAIFKAVVSATASALAALPGKVQSAVSKIPGIVSSIAGAVASAAMSVGRAIVDGIISGIKAGAGAIKDAAVGVAKGALDGAKSALGIKSPSRVFAAEVGKPIADGIAMGISWGQENAIAKAQSLADRLVKVAEKAKARADKIDTGKGMQKGEALADKVAKNAANRANAAQRAATKLQAAETKRQTALDQIGTKFALRNASINFNAAAFGTDELQRSTNLLASYKDQYKELAALLKTNGKKMTAGMRTDILNQMTDILGTIDTLSATTSPFANLQKSLTAAMSAARLAAAQDGVISDSELAATRQSAIDQLRGILPTLVGDDLITAQDMLTDLLMSVASSADVASDSLSSLNDQLKAQADLAKEEARISDAALRAFMSSPDIGFGGGANAYQAAGGAQPPVEININGALMANDPRVMAEIAAATNNGNSTGGNADRMYSGRVETGL